MQHMPFWGNGKAKSVLPLLPRRLWRAAGIWSCPSLPLMLHMPGGATPAGPDLLDHVSMCSINPVLRPVQRTKHEHVHSTRYTFLRKEWQQRT